MFDVHSKNDAPADSRPILAQAEENYGMVPNLYGVMAENPGTLKAYTEISGAFAESGLSAAEQQVVAIAASVENGCTYCVAAHSAISAGQQLFDEATLKALRNGQPLQDDRLEAVRSFTRTVVEKRGWLDDHELSAFLDAGFEKKDVLAVVTGVAMKTLSNFTNHLAETPLDEAFSDFAWEAPETAAV